MEPNDLIMAVFAGAAVGGALGAVLGLLWLIWTIARGEDEEE